MSTCHGFFLSSHGDGALGATVFEARGRDVPFDPTHLPKGTASQLVLNCPLATEHVIDKRL